MTASAATTGWATIRVACAILLWATLATLTVLTGPLPAFQTTAIAFTIGGASWCLPPWRAGGRT